MSLKISAGLKKSIQDEKKVQKSEVEDYVWNHKDHHCFLCGKELNRSADNIELDHDEAVAEGGSDEFKNLNLTHTECNRYKRNHNSIDVRPHLKFKRFWETQAGAVNFQKALQFYDIKPKEVYLKISKDTRSVEISHGTGKAIVPIFSETVGEKAQQFCFANLPISAVQNDDATQPRTIKLNHLLSIAADLKSNPLHEQPACRLEGDGDNKQVLMFDGQHKTVANLINGHDNLVFKIYLNISKQEAIRLVNSVQSRIKKLPLTPFELASKMSDEFVRKLEDYEADVGSSDASEEGFINWLDPSERSRAKSGIQSAIIDRVMSDETLDFAKIIERAGKTTSGQDLIKEATFQNSVLKTLLFAKPLPKSLTGEDMKLARERESRNVIRLLNMVFDRGFVPQADKDPEREVLRIKRLKYQASLGYMCKVFRQLASSLVMPLVDDATFYEREFTEENWKRMSAYIDRFFSHPVWNANLNDGKNSKAVEDALSKNQNIDQAFRGVGLTPGYCGGLDSLPTNWAG